MDIHMHAFKYLDIINTICMIFSRKAGCNVGLPLNIQEKTKKDITYFN